ncbi:hypothetical protein CHLRE_13g591900v5 [Chlamydomonas reinhardtii]|uniref:Mitochondrial cardiolipin hydrolase n=2 Tax=Chlamydomonas reinhardtii TaxID=3055 RepID=PLD6_CHLRE|nr:uncharacterized protein CHLRE_13g591900v5 [Chlamydomonas reinhardtii]A8IW99.1 RecName: Full=Mitochondrial cardiolipin hydrolase; AltName: Full=Phospholipase D6 homolog; Short=PLD 6 [Chlamydomonas reinhardtii]PNW74265.1 hypothetical protein CHLRE_13g591900v5 [Chlamydomonas reinhardtii]|eukprot:XP_001693080.1 predicted protein [Chlamydomonas reinhardtii]
MGCASSKEEVALTPLSDVNAAKEVADLKAQVDQLKRQLASAGQSAAPAAAGAVKGGVVETLFFPDEKLPCRNNRRPGGCKRQHCEYSHTPTSLSRFLDYLGSATRTLDICVFTITNDDISDVVLELHNKGVRVRIISDNDQAHTQGSDIDKFRQAGIAVRQDKTAAHMHHKFAIIDGRLLLNGSFNWTRQAVTANNENVTVLSDPKLIASFQQQFDKLWDMFK